MYAGFELNKTYIATTLCENRDKPQLHCNGRCYFMKKIKQARDKENAESRDSQKNLFQEAYYPQPSEVKFHSVLLSVMSAPYHPAAGTDRERSIFQPPRLS